MKRSSYSPDPSLHSPIQEQKTFPEDHLMKNGEKGQENWPWTVGAPQERLNDRYPLMRRIHYSFSVVRENTQVDSIEKSIPTVEEKEGSALSLNLHSKGMLMIMDEKVEVSQVLKIGVPTPFTDIHTPTLAEIRWIKNTPFPHQSPTRFVGIKFLL